MDYIFLPIGLIALVFGADKLVEGASAIATKYGIPKIVIGLTIVAFGTSAPELVVNLFAAFNGNTGIVLGNVIGSNIFNILGILGICAIIYPLSVKTETTWLEIPLSFLAGLAVLIMAADFYLDGIKLNAITRTDGLTLLLFFAIFLVYNINLAKKGVLNEDIGSKILSLPKSLAFVGIGLAGLVIGGKLIVDSATGIALNLGLSERIIGLTIVSIGTSLPELATSVVAVRKRSLDIAIGNVVGSNIFNIFFILGLSATVRQVPVALESFPDLSLNILASLLLFVFIFTGKGHNLNRWEGSAFLMLYISYLAYLIFN